MTLPTITAQGRLSADPQLRFTGAGRAVAKLSIACNDNKRDDQGAWHTVATTWLDVSLWDAEAETAAEQLRKGDELIVSGLLLVETFEGKDGVERRNLTVKFPKVARCLPRPPRVAAGESATDAPF